MSTVRTAKSICRVDCRTHFVLGVGFEIARRWYLKGYRSLDMVVKKEPLSTAQKIGVELYRDLLEKYV
jgi:hypothetical protein